MLGYLQFKSYRMFEGISSLSCYADCRSKRLLCNATEKDGRMVLKSLGIYGVNNSGKTSIIDLFAILKSIFDDQWARLRFNEAIFGDDETTEIEVEWSDDALGWLRYGFTYSRSGGFMKECLSLVRYYVSGKARVDNVLFVDRPKKEFRLFGHKPTADISIISPARPLLYSISSDLSEYPRLKAYIDCFHRFADSLQIVRLDEVPMQATLEAMKSQDEEAKSFITRFVKLADVSVDYFGYDGDGDSDWGQYTNRDLHRLYTEYSKHGAIHRVPSILFDSNGTKRIEALASYIYYSLKYGQTLIVDELDNGLHYILTRTIINCFDMLSNERAQLIFTAHDFTILDRPNILRKDQLYFTDRQGEGSTLICAKEFPVYSGGPRGQESLLHSYQSGDLVRRPYPDFADLLLGIG